MLWDPDGPARKPPQDSVDLLLSVVDKFDLAGSFRTIAKPDFVLMTIGETSRSSIERAHDWLIPIVSDLPGTIARLPPNASCVLLLRAYGGGDPYGRKIKADAGHHHTVWLSNKDRRSPINMSLSRFVRSAVMKSSSRSLIFATSTTGLLLSPLLSEAFTSPFNQYCRLQRRTAMGSAADDVDPFPSWTFDKPSISMELSPINSATLSIGGDFMGTKDSADLVILGVPAVPKKAETDSTDDDEEDPVELDGVVKTVDESLDGALSDLISENTKSFRKVGSTTPTLRIPSTKQRYIVLGLGDGSDEEGIGFTLGKAVASVLMAEKKVGKAHILLPIAKDPTIMGNFATALYQSLHEDNRFRTGSNIKKVAEDLDSIEIFVDEPASTEVIDEGRNIASGILLAKDIVNAPHNVLNSISLADTARKISDESPYMELEILGKDECEKAGMGAFLGVARGSETEPQFIHLTYKPPDGKVNKKVGVIGKGLLFDTGGYNIKTKMMELMKFDCGGAAAVLGAARAVGALAPPGVEAHFVVAACENMINEKAYVPSDILQASNGKTIEVLNTDAEGRLTLADALVFCDKKLECEKIIELSTLTGACMVALGKQLCGLWTENDDLADELLAAAKVTGDKSWRMPMAKEYNEQLESKIADLKNIGGPYGGSITAALFLQNFVEGKKPFAHLDIAGPVWDDKIGATGFGTKLVVEWVKQQGK